MDNLTKMAEAVQAAYDRDGEAGQHSIQELFAEELDITHNPPAEFDGTVSRDFLISYQNDNYEKVKATIREINLSGTVTVENGRLVVTKDFQGVTNDGAPVHSISRAEYLVDGDRIVGAVSSGTLVAKAFQDAGADVD